MLKLVVVWALAALFFLNALSVTLRSNFNAGVLLLWGIALVLVCYGVFHVPVDAFLARGFGPVLKTVLLAGAAVYAALICFLLFHGRAAPPQGNEAAIIVLGAGIRGQRLGNMLRRRLEAAHAAWQENPLALLVVTGGQGPQESIPEAQAARRWLLAQGVPEEKIVVEDKSVSTEENLAFARALLLARGLPGQSPVAVATSRFHCYRAKCYAQKAGFCQVRFIPAGISATAMAPSYLREVLAVLFLWVFRRGQAQ